MKLGLKTLALALVVTLLAVPAAFAKGHDHGKSGSHGRPAWAGLGKSHEKKAKHQNKHQQAGADAATADQPQSTDLSLEDLNPAWYCKTLALINPDSFSSLATNANGANAFGKCVSARAHGDDVAAQLDQPSTCDQPPADGTTTDSSGDGTTTDSSGDGTTTDSSGDGTTTDSSGDCQSDGSAGQDDQAGQDEQDDQGESDSAQGDEDNQGDAVDPAAFAKALLFFVRL